MGWLGWVQVRSIGLRVKKGHFEHVKNGFRSIGLRVKSSRVGLTCIFHMNFFFFLLMKKICICHLESYATNYLM